LVRKLREQGDFSHDAKGHVCAKCRCRSVAGSGTKGDWYGIGEETGHYGCGFCAHHERGRRSGMAEKFAENHMKALQLSGRAEVDRKDLKQCMEETKEISKRKVEMREGFQMVLETLKEFREAADGSELTETAGGKVVKMSDKSRMLLACQLAKAVADLEKDYRFLDPDDMIHVDDIKLRLRQTISLTNRFIHEEDDRSAWIQELKRIWISMRGIAE